MNARFVEKPISEILAPLFIEDEEGIKIDIGFWHGSLEIPFARAPRKLFDIPTSHSDFIVKNIGTTDVYVANSQSNKGIKDPRNLLKPGQVKEPGIWTSSCVGNFYALTTSQQGAKLQIYVKLAQKMNFIQKPKPKRISATERSNRAYQLAGIYITG